MTLTAIKNYLMTDIIDAFGDVSPQLYNALLNNGFQTVAHLYALDRADVKKQARCYGAALEKELEGHMEKCGFPFGSLSFPQPRLIVDLSHYQEGVMFMPLAESGFASKAEIDAAIAQHGVIMRDEEGNSILKQGWAAKDAPADTPPAARGGHGLPPHGFQGGPV